jgi:predicted ester cyclase
VQTPGQEAAMRATEEMVREYLRAREIPDLELLDEVVAEGFVHEMRGQQQDRAGLFAEVNALGKVFADMRHEIGTLFSTGEQVACRYTLSGLFGFERGQGVMVASLDQSGLPA